MAIREKKLEWDEKYSVGVQVLDQQHKAMFSMINQLIDHLNSNSLQSAVELLMKQLIAYKQAHFGLEEKYFQEFQYEHADEHILKHREFGKKLDEINERCSEDYLSCAFLLVDYLEDWLIDHLMTMDQGYVKCFHEHGLK